MRAAGAYRKLAKVTREIVNIVAAITKGMFHASMKTKMDGLEAERSQLEALLASRRAPKPVALHPGLASTYAAKVADLAAALNDPASKPEAVDLLRGSDREDRSAPGPGCRERPCD